ncbi:MAG: hypothetical protein HZA20_00660 [Nitrospirae bacterium]|nr:hypothetical protein [Nitrospirota bacterium]
MVIAIPRYLRERLGDEASEDLAQVLDRVEKEAHGELVTKDFFERRLAEEVNRLDVRLIKWMIGIGIAVVTLLFSLLKLVRF